MAGRSPALRLLHHWPTRLLCLVLITLQAASMNWYLMDNLSYTWAAIYCADVAVLGLFITTMLMAASNIHDEKRKGGHVTLENTRYLPFTFIVWIVYAAVLNVKICIIFVEVAEKIKEDNFFEANTLKSTMALTGVIFLTFLATQHDLKSGERKDLIFSLVGYVLFDILDGVDNMEILLEKEERETFPVGLDDAIISICCVNMILPAVPLLTLVITKFGLRKVPKRLELLHRLAVAYAVNLPLFITRMITWYGVSQGISIFALKNLITMGLTTFELLENQFTQEYITKDKKKKYTCNCNGAEMSDLSV